MPPETKGRFIVFEGGEGSGKTTQLLRLGEEFRKRTNREIILTKEPGGKELDGSDGISTEIRKLLLTPRYQGQFPPLAEFLGFEMDRAVHVARVIKPAIARGAIVLCDRFNASTFAYQVIARRAIHQQTFETIDRMARDFVRPSFAFWLDCDPEVGLRRKSADEQNRFEAEAIEFHRSLRRGFEKFFEGWCGYPSAKINASKSPEEIHREIVEIAERQRLFE